MKQNTITIIGAGNFGTALGHRLLKNSNNDVTLLSVEEDVVASINQQQLNPKYFPGTRLSKRLKATTDTAVLSTADYIFVALPSFVVVDYIRENKHWFNPDSIVINLAKGFSKNNKTSIVEAIVPLVSGEVCTLKGPTFSREVLNGVPTAMTLGAYRSDLLELFRAVFQDTEILLDYSDDVVGVELLSILKNIYAIAIGIIDAHYNAANLKFLILTKAFNEMGLILEDNGGKRDTLFKYCGFGDFNLTALNDLSRNRTLGLLIGKGFFTRDISNHVLLEGQIAVNVFCHDIYTNGKVWNDYPIIGELYKVFNEPDYEISNFVKRLLV
jgi:glycerol-3-phosphate dehydrogenase (NAD(P)+)